jgi:hypothetical protein
MPGPALSTESINRDQKLQSLEARSARNGDTQTYIGAVGGCALLQSLAKIPAIQRFTASRKVAEGATVTPEAPGFSRELPEVAG